MQIFLYAFSSPALISFMTMLPSTMFSVFTVSLGSGSRARLARTRALLEIVCPANRSRHGSPLGT